MRICTRVRSMTELLLTWCIGILLFIRFSAVQFFALCAAVFALYVIALSLPLRLDLAQVLFQAVKTLLPETAVLFDPPGCGLQWRGLELARAPLSLAATSD